MNMSLGMGLTYTRAAPAEWLPTDLGSDVKLWLRPEELINPNLLLQTADFENGAWTNNNGVYTSGHADPDGGAGAQLMLAGSASDWVIQNAQGFQVGVDHTLSLWIKRGPEHNGTSKFRMRFNDGVGSTDINVVPPESWTRYESTRTFDGAASRARIQFYPDSDTGGTTPQAVYIYAPQLESGIAASPYKANGATAGGIISSWADQSGNGNDATQGTQAKMPLVKANALDGHAGALFDGVDDYFAFVELLGAATSDWEFFFVISGLITVDTLFETNPGGGRGIIGTNGGAMGWYDNTWANYEAPTGTPQLLEYDLGNPTGILRKNGTALTLASGSAAYLHPISITNTSRIGSRTTGANFYKGTMLELVFLSERISASNRALLESYFAAKYPTLGM